MEESGEDEAVDEAEARELFELLRGADDEDDDDDTSDATEDEVVPTSTSSTDAKDDRRPSMTASPDLDFGSDEFQRLYAELEKEMEEEGTYPTRNRRFAGDKSIEDCSRNTLTVLCPLAVRRVLQGWSSKRTAARRKSRDQLLAAPNGRRWLDQSNPLHT